MLYCTISFLANSHLHILLCQLVFRPFWSLQIVQENFSGRYSQYKLNRIGDKQHPCLISLPVFILLASHWSSHTFFLASRYQFSFRICINLVLFIRSNTICHSVKQAPNSSSVSKFRCGILLSISLAFLISFPLLPPKWLSPGTSSILFCIIFLSILSTIFATWYNTR
jgi:hypothetical protein